MIASPTGASRAPLRTRGVAPGVAPGVASAVAPLATLRSSSPAFARDMATGALALLSLSVSPRVALAGPGDAIFAASAASATFEPCTITLDGVDTSDWQQVQAKGFSFCVPGEWKVSGSRARHAGGQIEWAVGRPLSDKKAFTVGQVAGRPSSPPIGLSNAARTFNEQIGGANAELTTSRFQGTMASGATFESQRIYFAGESRSDELMRQQLDVYRTVRFADAPEE